MAASGNARRLAAQRGVRVGGRELPLDSPVLEQAAALERSAYLAQRAILAPLPPARERSSVAEAAWQKQVVAVARALGWVVYHPKLSRWSEQGFPDLTMLHPGMGRALWAELKSDGGQLSEHQVAWIGYMRACGLEVVVWRPWHGLEMVAQVLQRRGLQSRGSGAYPVSPMDGRSE